MSQPPEEWGNQKSHPGDGVKTTILDPSTFLDFLLQAFGGLARVDKILLWGGGYFLLLSAKPKGQGRKKLELTGILFLQNWASCEFFLSGRTIFL